MSTPISMRGPQSMSSQAANQTINLAIWIASIGYFVDLFDTFLVPALRIPMLKGLGVDDADSLGVYTTIFNWQLAGMFLGAVFLWGPLADMRGRRRILLGSILLYGLGSMLTAAAQDVGQLTVIRFITGVGLGGELGAGVTLVAENMARDKRGRGTMLIGFTGMLGVVAASLLAKTGLDWRVTYVIGGVLALAVLAIRIGVPESTLFLRSVSGAANTISYGARLRALLESRTLLRLIGCVMVGAPTFFVTGLVVPGAPEFASAFGMRVAPSPTTALIWAYLSIAIGDVLCGALSQWLRSRKRALLIFHAITLLGIGLLVLAPPTTPTGFYVRGALAGLGIGFWANMVTNAAEQFGTDLRGTVTIIVPTAVRLLLFPISAAVWSLKPVVGFVNAAAIVGLVTSALAILATLMLKDGFSLDLDFKTLSRQPDTNGQPDSASSAKRGAA